jgi:hypothetical protein
MLNARMACHGVGRHPGATSLPQTDVEPLRCPPGRLASTRFDAPTAERPS